MLMTALTYLIIRYYYKSSFGVHFQNLQRYLDELKD